MVLFLLTVLPWRAVTKGMWCNENIMNNNYMNNNLGLAWTILTHLETESPQSLRKTISLEAQVLSKDTGDKAYLYAK